MFSSTYSAVWAKTPIVGEIVLAHYKESDQIRLWLETLLDKEVTGNAERALFGLPPRPPEAAGS